MVKIDKLLCSLSLFVFCMQGAPLQSGVEDDESEKSGAVAAAGNQEAAKKEDVLELIKHLSPDDQQSILAQLEQSKKPLTSLPTEDEFVPPDTLFQELLDQIPEDKRVNPTSEEKALGQKILGCSAKASIKVVAQLKQQSEHWCTDKAAQETERQTRLQTTKSVEKKLAEFYEEDEAHNLAKTIEKELAEQTKRNAEEAIYFFNDLLPQVQRMLTCWLREPHSLYLMRESQSGLSFVQVRLSKQNIPPDMNLAEKNIIEMEALLGVMEDAYIQNKRLPLAQKGLFEDAVEIEQGRQHLTDVLKKVAQKASTQKSEDKNTIFEQLLDALANKDQQHIVSTCLSAVTEEQVKSEKKRSLKIRRYHDCWIPLEKRPKHIILFVEIYENLIKLVQSRSEKPQPTESSHDLKDRLLSALNIPSH